MRLLGSAALLASAYAIGMVDQAISSGYAPQYLDGEGWQVTSADGSINIGAKVPGDLLTDL
jgi:hypothetical protein